MDLLRYFETDDGSLPEISVGFQEPSNVVKAFALLFTCGGEDASEGGSTIWLRGPNSAKELDGASDANLVVTGEAESFHVVLSGITIAGCTIPDLGVFVDPDGLVIDYRMGPSWGSSQVDSLLALLRQLIGLGGTVTVPWWDVDGNAAFLNALRAA